MAHKRDVDASSGSIAADEPGFASISTSDGKFRPLQSHTVALVTGVASTATCRPAITLIQRFGSALNLNIHFHMLFLDGAYLAGTQPPAFRHIAAPSASGVRSSERGCSSATVRIAISPSIRQPVVRWTI
jgi:hypothetical protein